jgi:hypothetical protein
MMDALGVVALLRGSEAPRPSRDNDLEWYYRNFGDDNRPGFLHLLASAVVGLTSLIGRPARWTRPDPVDTLASLLPWIERSNAATLRARRLSRSPGAQAAGWRSVNE